MTQAASNLAEAIACATDEMRAWLSAVPEWPSHPTNASGSVSSHFGPTILSEHDCVLHFARFLNLAGVPWEDLHMELSPGQWMYRPAVGAGLPRRIDLAVIERDRLLTAGLPVAVGELRLSAVFEFALASNYWRFGTGSPRATLKKVDDDVAKVAEYLRTGLADHGYVVVIEECDHRFPSTLGADARSGHGVEVVLLRRWC